MTVPTPQASELGLLVAALLMLIAPPSVAQETHVVGEGELERITATERTTEQRQRDLVLDVLERERVQEVAADMQVDLTEARAAVRTMEGSALERTFKRAQQVENALVGGDSTIVISSTTLIIALLVLIILLIA